MKWMVKKSGVNLAAYTRLLVINGELRFCFIKFAYHNYYLVFFYNRTLSLGIIKLNISIFSSFHSISEWKLYFFPATISCIVIILGWSADWLTDSNRWYCLSKILLYFGNTHNHHIWYVLLLRISPRQDISLKTINQK